MPTYTMPPETVDSTSTLVYLSTNLPWLFPGLLIFIFISFALANFAVRERRNGKGDLIESLALSSFITATSSIMLYLIKGLVNIYTPIIAVSVMLLFVLVYIMRDTSNTGI